MKPMMRTFETSLAATLPRLLGMLWVRRYLWVTPLLLSIPLALVLAMTLPRSYVARTLLLLQESGGDSPLSREVRNPESSRDRISGLQTLVKSERIMKAVLREVRGGTLPESQIELALALAELSRAVSVEVLTNDMIEVRLRGSKPVGMGKTLEAVTARLLESLLSPEDVILTAPQLLVDRRKEQIEIAERALAAFIERARTRPKVAAPARAPADRPAAIELTTLIEEQNQTLAAIERLRTELALANADRATLIARIDQARTSVAGYETRTDAPREELVLARRQLEQLLRLQELEEQQDVRQVTINRIVERAAPARSEAATADEIAAEQRALEMAVESARERYAATLRRFGTRAGATPVQILRAPERITIIDPPKDPDIATVSRSTIAALTMLGALVIGLGLALTSDMLDPRLRSANRLQAISGVPIWGRLPYEK
jgi:capsular polysaccharide biosynthesis protein